MQALETIHRQNAQATEAAARSAAAAGQLVLLKYSGLNFVDYSTHETEAARNQAAIDWNNAAPGNRSGFATSN
jgi:hypothetical protein